MVFWQLKVCLVVFSKSFRGCRNMVFLITCQETNFEKPRKDYEKTTENMNCQKNHQNLIFLSKEYNLSATDIIFPQNEAKEYENALSDRKQGWSQEEVVASELKDR